MVYKRMHAIVVMELKEHLFTALLRYYFSKPKRKATTFMKSILYQGESK